MSRTRNARNIKMQQNRIRKNVQTVVHGKIPLKIERALTAIGVVVGNRAIEFTPLDTGALINSQDRDVREYMGGYRLSIVYTQSYAAALHNRDDWKPRPPGSPGKPNGGYNPRAIPEWMDAADTTTRPTQRRILTGETKL